HEPGHLSRSGRQGGEHSIEPSHPAPAPVAGPSHGDPAQGLGRVTPSGAGGFDHSPDGEEASGGGETKVVAWLWAVLRSRASRSDPSGLCPVEAFGNSLADSVSFRFPSWQSHGGVRDARNNERHVCARRRAREPAGSSPRFSGDVRSGPPTTRASLAAHGRECWKNIRSGRR